MFEAYSAAAAAVLQAPSFTITSMPRSIQKLDASSQGLANKKEGETKLEKMT